MPAKIAGSSCHLREADAIIRNVFWQQTNQKQHHRKRSVCLSPHTTGLQNSINLQPMPTRPQRLLLTSRIT